MNDVSTHKFSQASAGNYPAMGYWTYPALAIISHLLLWVFFLALERPAGRFDQHTSWRTSCFWKVAHGYGLFIIRLEGLLNANSLVNYAKAHWSGARRRSHLGRWPAARVSKKD